MTEASELEYVGFWARVWASVIDTALMIALIVPMLFAIYGKERLANGVTLTGGTEFLLSYVLPAIVVIVFWSAKQATPGKMVIGAIIVDAKTGQPPSMKQQIVRYLGYFISTFFLCLGFVWIGFDRKKQGWHDKLAGTVVVRSKNRGTEPVRFG